MVDCPVLAGDFQLLNFFLSRCCGSLPERDHFLSPRRCGCFPSLGCCFLRRLLRGLVISFHRCGWWTVPVCCGHCFHAASEGDEHCSRRRCGSMGIPNISLTADPDVSKPCRVCTSHCGRHLIPSTHRCGGGRTLGHPTNVSAATRPWVSIV